MTKFRLSLTKSIEIDLFDPDPQSIGAGWAEQTLEALRDDNPSAQIDTSDIDELTGALLRVLAEDISIAISDLDITKDDFTIEVLPKQEPKQEPKP